MLRGIIWSSFRKNLKFLIKKTSLNLIIKWINWKIKFNLNLNSLVLIKIKL